MPLKHSLPLTSTSEWFVWVYASGKFSKPIILAPPDLLVNLIGGTSAAVINF